MRESVQECGLQEGVFFSPAGFGTEVGVALVKHPLVKAVGFTGSHKGGRAIMDAAAARHDPIPVFAEMGSTNPVFILPGALRENGENISAGMCKSFTLGAGQFCTKPGIVFLPGNNDASTFVDRLKKSVLESRPVQHADERYSVCLSICHRRRKTRDRSDVLAERPASANDQQLGRGRALFEAERNHSCEIRRCAAEVFGPATLIVRHSSRAQVLEIARNLAAI